MSEQVKLPEHCECGGKMVYVSDFGLTFSHCNTCTPVVVVGRARLSPPKESPSEDEAERVLLTVFRDMQDWDGYLTPNLKPIFKEWMKGYDGDGNAEHVFLAQYVARLIARLRNRGEPEC